MTLYETSDDDSAAARRRKRSGRSSRTNKAGDETSVDIFSKPAGPKLPPSEPSKATFDAGTEASVEERFGLGNDQLRDLLEQELPLPREDLVSRKEAKEAEADKVFSLPELSEFLKDAESDRKTKKERKEAGNDDGDSRPRVSRKNEEAYLRLLQLNPFADADDSLFLDEVRNSTIIEENIF